MKILIFILTIYFAKSFELDTNDLKYRYGVYGNYGLGINIADFSKLPSVSNCCNNFLTTNGNVLEFGLLTEIPLTNRYGIGARLKYQTSNVEFESEENVAIVVDNQIVDGGILHTLNSDLDIIGSDLYFFYFPINNLEVWSGISLGLINSMNYYQIEKIVNPTDRGVFKEEGTSFRNQFEGEVAEKSSFQFGLNFGASYRLPLNKTKSLFVIPEVSYKPYFTNLVNDISWSLHSINLGVSVQYRKPPLPPPPPPPPPLPINPKLVNLPEELPKLTADITSQQILDDTDKSYGIKIEDFISYNMRPLLNFIFFDDNSSEIPKRYLKLDKNDVSSFDLSNLKGLTAIETYYHILNIFGKRLTDKPTFDITLVGTNSNTDQEVNNLLLSNERALKVKEYLVDIWNIAPGRIKIEARNLPKQASRTDTLTGTQENRRVEILGDPEILESVFTLDTLRVIKNTTFRFQPEVFAEIGLKNWRVEISQNNSLLKNFDGNEFLPRNLEWFLDSTYSKKIQNGKIDYFLSATDELGQKVKSLTKSIEVEQLSVDKKRFEGISDKEFEYYSLILFPYGKSDLGNEHKKTVDFVKSRINPTANVKVIGYSDSVGEEAINKRIAEARANQVASRLKISNMSVEGVGESQILYDNSLPEGRFYCRTVTIQIETSINK